MLSSYPIGHAYVPNLSRIDSFKKLTPMKIGNYFIEKTLGKGNFAVVKLATHCDTKQKVEKRLIFSSGDFVRSFCV